jgi:outer membrane protein
MKTKHSIPLCAVLILGATLSPAAQADDAVKDKLTVRGGFTHIRPDVESGDLSAPSFAGTKSDVQATSQISGGLNYRLNKNLAIDLPLALPFKHDIVGAGAIASVGKIADSKTLPMTLLLQYHFAGEAMGLKPYAGVGLTYAKFFATKTTAALTALTGGTPSNPTTMSIQSAWGSTFQVGAAYKLNTRLGLDVNVTKTLLSTTANLSTGQTMQMSLNPWSLSAAVTYGF